MTGESELEKRVSDLESRIAFQEVAIEELNSTVFTQQRQIADLGQRVRELVDHVKPSMVSKEAESETPPHY